MKPNNGSFSTSDQTSTSLTSMQTQSTAPALNVVIEMMNNKMREETDKVLQPYFRYHPQCPSCQSKELFISNAPFDNSALDRLKGGPSNLYISCRQDSCKEKFSLDDPRKLGHFIEFNLKKKREERKRAKEASTALRSAISKRTRE